ncbi:hypothetical protein RhiLY_03040 [Ceratobasidium sp. AG-Ba]|nr:hypothetical protein RhiLY_03040 [Ceratobasidium sp. AG-Ba]
MAQTIRTAEKRLGLSTRDIITTYTLCPVCHRRYDHSYIATAQEDTCVNIGCTGILFTEKVLATGERRRVSNLTYPTGSIIAWLKRMFLQPGIAELMQSWRTRAEDTEEFTRPISADEWLEACDPNEPLGDISEGYAWRERHAGLREGGNLVYDDTELDPPVRFSSLPFGISLSMNTDWLGSRQQKNGAATRTFVWRVFPGPGEPKQYGLDQMLEPIVKELLELHSGVELRVRTGDPAVYEQCMVHANLCHHIADLIARIKIGGGAGVASELNFCLYCRSRLSSISVPAGFIRDNFPYRDPMEDLQNAYFWRSLESDEDRELFFEETGNRFTILQLLPGWHTSSCSPPDAMHLLYLGASNWILKQVVTGPNLLAPRVPNRPNPVDIYNTALEDDLWLPYSVGRLPPKLGQSRGRIKADQLKLMSKLMFVLFYLAMRDGDDLSEVNAPRGTKSSTGGKHQLKRAKLLHKL